MIALCQIHLDKGMEILPDLGIEHLAPLIMGGGQVDVAAIVQSLAGAARGGALRRFVVVTTSTADELLEAEADPAKQAALMRRAALLPLPEAKKAAVDFFASLGPFLGGIPASLEAGGMVPPPDTPSAGS